MVLGSATERESLRDRNLPGRGVRWHNTCRVLAAIRAQEFVQGRWENEDSDEDGKQSNR